MENSEIALIFNRTADILEFQDAGIFRVRAYRQAALNIEEMNRRLEDLYHEDPQKLGALPGIGESIKDKIIELLRTGKLKQFEQLKKEVPPGIFGLLNLEGLGPKRIKILITKLKIKNIEDLEAACHKGRLQKMRGFAKKTEEKLLQAIQHFHQSEGRMKLIAADQSAQAFLRHLRKSSPFHNVEIAGSYRRGKETVGDLDILVTASDPRKAVEAFTSYEGVERVLQKGETKCAVMLRSGCQVDMRVLDPSMYGAAMIYFTGSKSHNIKIRGIAKKKGLKISEYGVFREASNKRIAGKTEEEVYRTLNMPWIPPELREDQGEIEAALKNQLPELIVAKDVVGDLHVHTQATDGRNTVEEMLRAAKERSYEYLAITDHTKSTRVAGGLTEKEMGKQIDRIRQAEKRVAGIHALAGAEVDILGDGSLDLEDDFLKHLDIVIIAVHSQFMLSPQAMTERLLKAMDHPYVHLLAHPTGRLIGKRAPYNFDERKIFQAAKERNIFLEINSHEDRLDLRDTQIKYAKELGARFAINTDAHSIYHLSNIQYGVVTARRGWLEKKDVLNTKNLHDLTEAIQRK